MICLLASITFNKKSAVLLTRVVLSVVSFFFFWSPLRTFIFTFGCQPLDYNMPPWVLLSMCPPWGLLNFSDLWVGTFSSICKILTYSLFKYFLCSIFFSLSFGSPVLRTLDHLIFPHRSLIFLSVTFFSHCHFSLRFDLDGFYQCDFELKNPLFSFIQSGVWLIQCVLHCRYFLFFSTPGI